MTATDEYAEHEYNMTGLYNITLKVVNEDGMSNSTTVVVEVKEMEEGFNPIWILLVFILILTVAVVAYWVIKRKPKTAVEPPLQVVQAEPVSTQPVAAESVQAEEVMVEEAQMESVSGEPAPEV